MIHRGYTIIKKNETDTELIYYLHTCCFGPMPRTLMKAIKNGNLLNWEKLNNQTLLKHLPLSISTALGHLEY